ncbi:hypothetical protein F4821DRAFT_189061 [Hypoxylon rubiginosum]|uniref:Uncharacterized protein n=1 Tax=Hypoxylon rubiginosum TaxID=110542 RepID=A0ACC0DG07_9PEZI|nr:hypothetical protein F4821DRAFT_189061 [Hypoxylon rubiginosum]
MSQSSEDARAPAGDSSGAATRTATEQQQQTPGRAESFTTSPYSNPPQRTQRGLAQARVLRGAIRGRARLITTRGRLPASRSAATLARPSRRSGDMSYLSPQASATPPQQTIYENQPLEPTSSSTKNLSAGFTPGGPLSSNPTTGYSSVTATATRQTTSQAPGITGGAGSIGNARGDDNFGRQSGRPSGGFTASQSFLPTSNSCGDFQRLTPVRLRPSRVGSNIPVPSSSSPTRRSLGTPRSNLPVPKFALAPSTSSAALYGLKEENVPPISPSGLGLRARDSMLLPSTMSVPRKQGSGAMKHANTSTQEAASAYDIVGQPLPTVAPTVAGPKLEDPFRDLQPAHSSQSKQQQQPKHKSHSQQQEFELVDLPANKLPASKLPTFQSARQTASAKGKEVQRDQPASQLPLFRKPSPIKKQQQPSRLPKSSTLGVFSNLASSLSRTSLVGNINRIGGGSRKPSSSSTMADLHSQDNPNKGDKAPSTRDVTPVSAVPAAGPDPFESEEEDHPRFVKKAHGFEFWTGRFVAVQDRLKTEALQRQSIKIVAPAHTQQSQIPQPKKTGTNTNGNGLGLPTSNTTANIARVDPNQQAQTQQSQSQFATTSTTPLHMTLGGEMSAQGPQTPRAALNATILLVDDKARLRRTWQLLEASCSNNTSLYSLHQFQQEYARQFNMPQCLPKGGTMTDDDPKAKFFNLYPSWGNSSKAGTSNNSKAGGSKDAAKKGKEVEGKDAAVKKDDDSMTSYDSKGKGKGKGWVGRMFSGGKKSGNTSPK